MFIIKVVAGVDKPHTGVFSAHHFEITDKLTIYHDPYEIGNVIESPLFAKDTIYIMGTSGNTIDTIKILDK